MYYTPTHCHNLTATTTAKETQEKRRKKLKRTKSASTSSTGSKQPSLWQAGREFEEGVSVDLGMFQTSGSPVQAFDGPDRRQTQFTTFNWPWQL